MKIAFFGRSISEESLHMMDAIFEKCKLRAVEISLFEMLRDDLVSKGVSGCENIPTFSLIDNPSQFDIMMSIGGDGTFLRAARYVGKSGVPIAGINSGRLGFLADISMNSVLEIFDEICKGEYEIEERATLQWLNSPDEIATENYALNEIALLRRDTSSMLIVHVYINEQFLSSYWADGLIISTPTGSTAYSMSAGGPILAPQSKSFLITPIAPHSLNTRPIVIPDNAVFRLQIESRSSNFLVSIDSRSHTMPIDTSLEICKGNYTIKVLHPKNHHFYNTLRNKLQWGHDIRKGSE